MPSIFIYTGEGKTIKQKRALVKDMTDAVCNNFNVPSQAVSVHIIEGKKENRSKAGKLFVD